MVVLDATMTRIDPAASHSLSPAGDKFRFWMRLVCRYGLVAAALLVAGIFAWQGIVVAGNPDPTTARPGSFSAILDVGVLVFREGLECILILTAITASLVRSGKPYGRPVAAGVGIGFVTTLITWMVAASIVDDLTKSFPALYVQAGTGLLAIFVLLVIMNWFFHKVYWTGWISLHNTRKRELLEGAEGHNISHVRFLFGLALLGFTAFYREGVEVVLFLQSYRLKLGGDTVLYGVILGLLLTSAVAILTFVAHRKLPYKKMLVLTGVLLGLVLLVMVGEQAQEMQLAHWLPTTTIPWLAGVIPPWAALWFSVYPTAETLLAQAIALVVVLGSYFAVPLQAKTRRAVKRSGVISRARAHEGALR
ncbi:MAG TPA: FTR1 family protein [Bryobacteraceae bacterium]